MDDLNETSEQNVIRPQTTTKLQPGGGGGPASPVSSGELPSIPSSPTQNPGSPSGSVNSSGSLLVELPSASTSPARDSPTPEPEQEGGGFAAPEFDPTVISTYGSLLPTHEETIILAGLYERYFPDYNYPDLQQRNRARLEEARKLDGFIQRAKREIPRIQGLIDELGYSDVLKKQIDDAISEYNAATINTDRVYFDKFIDQIIDEIEDTSQTKTTLARHMDKFITKYGYEHQLTEAERNIRHLILYTR